MTTERWQRLEQVFADARQHPPDTRAEFVARTCGADEALRADALSLLAAADQSDEFMAWPALDRLANEIAAEGWSLRPGERVGAYTVDRLLGSGGSGEVWRARDERLGRNVAIKMLLPHFSSDAERLRRFAEEARTAGTLNHSNILAVYDVGEHRGAPFLVSECLEGESLRKRLDAGPLPVDKALAVAVQIASGLAAAHARGIIHRDLKPDNVFLRSDGGVKILDFGLAKLQLPATDRSQAAHPQTLTGVIVGTAGYMAPEQVRGEAVDARADLFALGATMYEMLGGQRPFRGASTIETLHAVLTTDPPDVSSVNHQVPPALAAIVKRLLEKAAGARFQSAVDLAWALEQADKVLVEFESPLAQRSGSVTPWRSAETAHRRHKKLGLMATAALAVLVVALLTAAGAFGFMIGLRRSTSSSPEMTRLTFDRGTIRAARFAPDGKTVIYGASWGGQPIKTFQTRIGSPESIPLQLPDAEVLAISSTGEVAISVGHRFRGWIGQGTLARAPLVGGSFRELLENVRAADWSPDGTELAIVRRMNGRDRLEYPVGTVLYETAGYISHPRVSPSGDVVAYHDHPVFGDNRGWVSIVTRSGQRRTLTREWGSEEGLAWSRDGREIWFAASETGRNMLFGVTLDGELRQIWAAPADLAVLDIGPDGDVLATANTIRTEIKWMAVEDSQERDISWHAWSFAKDLTADGKMVLLTRFDEGAGLDYQVGLRRIDAPTGVVLGEGTPSVFSPDSKWIIGVTYRQPSLFLLPAGTGERRTLTEPGFKYITAGWFPDGKRVIFVAQEDNAAPSAYVQDVAGGKPVRVSAAIPPLLPDWGIRVAPDGSSFFGAQAAGPPVIVPVSGDQPRALNDFGADDLPVAWTPDGRAILITRQSNDQMSAVIVRFDLLTGRIQTLREVKAADKSGGRGLSCIVTPDAHTVVCNIARYLTDLYLLKGLK